MSVLNIFCNTFGTHSAVAGAIPALFFFKCNKKICHCILNIAPSSGTIRLVRNGATSPNYTSGVVQVWWNGQWGNICNDASFGYDEADVVCHQLGWSGASYYTSSQNDRFVAMLLLYFLP